MPDEVSDSTTDGATGADQPFDQTNGVLGDDPYGDEHPEDREDEREGDEGLDLLEDGASSNIASEGL